MSGVNVFPSPERMSRSLSMDAIWESSEVREAIAARPGLDALAERRKLEVWLRDEAAPGVALTARLVLSWLEEAPTRG